MHGKIIPSLLSLLDDPTNLRVMTHAGAALVNFCEPCPSEILNQYMDAIASKLVKMMDLGLKEVFIFCLLLFLIIIPPLIPPPPPPPPPPPLFS